MPVRRGLMLALALPLLATRVEAQDPNAAARIAKAREALAPLSLLVGQWEGDARVTERSGVVRIRQSEDIALHSLGTALIIRGTGHGLEGEMAGKIVFEATAIMWFDADSNRVRMRTHRDGGTVEPMVEMKPDTLSWGFPVRGGKILYTIAYTRDTWHEVGHFLREGAAPLQIIDMRLKKKAAK